ncbi:AsmA family protein [Devosia sp. 63-57]|uniref:AsmA family protein n=1 Tax=Devosia sp. 63-57 TaxID=1895751 RepID=UPI000A622CE6|nr:AsmA family protein [Devosia sp. 63-57]
MRKAILIGAICLAALAGLVFLAPIAVNSAGLRTALSDQLSRVSGARIALNGPIHFSILPDFGVVVEDFGYSSGDGAFEVTSQRSVASVGLWALFTGQIQITGIELRNPRIQIAESTAATEASPATTQSDDIFRLVAGYLENVSIDHITISDGEVATSRNGVLKPMASDIDMRLSIPGIAAPASLSVSALVGTDHIEFGAEIGSLRDLLSRQPAHFSLSAKTDHPPHPALADISASGSIQLAEDGSYRIAGGEIASIGQKMLLDANYVPGERPFVVARIKAGSLAYADFAPPPADAAAITATAPAALDLSPLKALNADIELYAEAVSVGDATARDIVLSAKLDDGRLIATVDSTSIAGGSLVASMALDANNMPTVSSGSLNLTSIDIQQLLALAGQDAPLTGALSSELQYAFKGMDAVSIRNSLNLRGKASVAQGRVDIPQLASIAGQNAGTVDALAASIAIEDMLKPMSVTGSAIWNGEKVDFSTAFTATDVLWGKTGIITLDLKSGPLNAGFSGTVSPAGQLSGKADISAPSLTRALGWVGQSIATPLGRFAFSGGVSVDGSQFAVANSTIQLDDIAAKGSLSLAMAGKPSIIANLSVDTLDFGALLAGGGSAQAAASSGPAPIDLTVLRLFNADISLEANQLGYGKVRMGPATAKLSVVDGVAKLSVPQAGFYEGVISAEITANGAGATPALAVVAAMDNVQSLPLLRDAAGFEHLEGRLRASMQVSGTGSDSQAFAKSLNGPMSLVVSDGAIRGIDVAGLVRNVRSLIGAGYAQDANARTEFSELSIPVTITNGVARAEDIRVLGPFIRMSGSGSVDLAAQTIDMRLDPRVVASLDGQGGDFDVSGLGMPIMITGPLSGPRIYPDLSSLLADPSRALQALTQLGGGVGDLAGNASGLIEGLGTTLGTDTGALGNTVLNDAIGQMLGNQGQSTNQGATPDGQNALNSVIGNALGQQFPGLAPPTAAPQQQPTTTDVSAPAAATANVPLPRPDPRGPSPLPSFPSQPQPTPAAPPATPTQQVIDLIAPQQTQPPDGTATTGDDPLQGLFNQLGF